MNLRKNKLHRCLSAAFLAVVLLWSGQARAHFPWIEMGDYAAAAKNAPRIRIGWGHAFPSENFLGADDLEEIFLLSATGTRIAVEPNSATEFTTRAGLADGTYLVAGQRKSSFYTKTTEGGKRQAKNGLDNVVKCSWSTMGMKSVVNVGAGKGAVDQVAGHPLEIIPLVNPARLKAGDTLPVRVLLNGKPYSGEITAVYRGVAEKKETLAAAPITTDQNGRSGITIAAPGIWLLKAQYERPYARPEECDVESYVATLTFAVR